MKKVMIQGTSSGAGKSIVSAALCRCFYMDGHRVTPFKPQNMALNSYITREGLEMGRAQVVQAEGCGKTPTVHMNPILLKPAGNNISQVIVQGKIYGNMDSFSYRKTKDSLKPKIMESFKILEESNDIMVIEGAGSPAELNMMDNDISNMGSAEILDAPVILVADIDRGGVFAAIYGTIMLQKPQHKSRIKGIIINKFTGRKELLREGIEKIEELTGVPVIGILPYQVLNLEDEDSITEKTSCYSEAEIKIEIVRFPHLSNSTDFEALRRCEGVGIRYVSLNESFDNPDLIILPGTKNTISDLMEFKKSKLKGELDVIRAKEKTPIIGICGGYQMLGSTISDPNHLEDQVEEILGLGYLNHNTIFKDGKTTTQIEGIISTHEIPAISCFTGLSNLNLKGYEIHSGLTNESTLDIPFIQISRVLGKDMIQDGGRLSKDYNVLGTYIHGLFDNDDFTHRLINNLRKKKGLKELNFMQSYLQYKEVEYKKLEMLFRENVDMEKIYSIIW